MVCWAAPKILDNGDRENVSNHQMLHNDLWMSTYLVVQAHSHVCVEMSTSTHAYDECFALSEEN